VTGTGRARKRATHRLGERRVVRHGCRRGEWHPGRQGGRPMPMENTILIGVSRQMVLQREVDVGAHNVANPNTTGFKANAASFEEYLMPVARAGNFKGADQRLSYVQDRGTWLDLAQGALQQTGNPLDVAIDGEAFLAVQTPRGERYTRNGALQLNAT